ncbi:MAG: pyridoxamine 5'-phosphate oxidase family protein [Nocardioides sp.]
MEHAYDLSDVECRELLASDVIGRVAFVTPQGPRIMPINYVVSGETIEFLTTGYSEVAVYGVGAEVVFEIDHIDNTNKSGWSVIAHGTLERHENPSETALRAHGDGPIPWAGGHRPLLLVLAWRELTGRRVGAHWPHPVVSGRGDQHH